MRKLYQNLSCFLLSYSKFLLVGKNWQKCKISYEKKKLKVKLKNCQHMIFGIFSKSSIPFEEMNFFFAGLLLWRKKK